MDTYEQEVRAQAEQMGGQVLCSGYVDNGELYRYHALVDLAVVPSLWEEGAGLITVEAMATGLPLVVTRSGGMPEYVDEGCAVILEKGEGVSQRLAQAIKGLKDAPERREAMSRHGRTRAERFTYQHYYRNYVDVLKDILLRRYN